MGTISFKKLLEQENRFLNYKFEFAGVIASENSLNLKLYSKALVSNLMNTAAKETGEKYSYKMKYITASKNSLEAELGIELEFVEKLSIGGNVVFKMKIETLTKEIIKKLYNLTFVQFMVDVRKPNTTEPAEEEPKKTPPEEKTPEETPAEQPAAETKPTEKPKQPNQYSAL
jgi:hypothetical protein